MIILFIIYSVYWDSIVLIFRKETITLIIGLILGVFFLSIKKQKTVEILDDWSLIKYVNYVLGNNLSPILIVSTLICIIMFNIGISDGATKLIVLTKIDKKTILIRKYSEYSLYGIPDSINSKLQSVIIERSSTDIDTLYITSNKIVISRK